MSRKAYLYFLLTFVLGVLIGWAGAMMFGWYRGWRPPRPPNPQRIVNYLRRELNLTPQQAQQVLQIIQDTGKKFNDLHRQMEPQFQAVRDESRNRIRQILNAQQLQKFNQLVQEWDARMHRHPPPRP